MTSIQAEPHWKEQVGQLLATFLQRGPTWRPGLAEKHLVKRIKREHLPATCTLEQYNQLVTQIVTSADHETYVYAKEIFDQNYVVFGDKTWIVILGQDGIMETAFPPDDYKAYLAPDRGYTYLGTVEELMNDGC